MRGCDPRNAAVLCSANWKLRLLLRFQKLKTDREQEQEQLTPHDDAHLTEIKNI